MTNEQVVAFAPNDPTEIKQTATVVNDAKTQTEWVNVTHNGDELSMSISNWHNLCDLVAATRIQNRMSGK